MNLVHNDLNVTRLPISPRPHFHKTRYTYSKNKKESRVFFACLCIFLLTKFQGGVNWKQKQNYYVMYNVNYTLEGFKAFFFIMIFVLKLSINLKNKIL